MRAKGKCVSVPVGASYGFEQATGDVQLRPSATDARQIEPDTVTLMVDVDETGQKTVGISLLDATTGAELASIGQDRSRHRTLKGKPCLTSTRNPRGLRRARWSARISSARSRSVRTSRSSCWSTCSASTVRPTTLPPSTPVCRVVNTTLSSNFVRPDEANKVQSMVKDKGKHTLIDKVKVRYLSDDDKHWAELVNFGHKYVHIPEHYLREFDRLLMGGIWAQVDIHHQYDEEATGKRSPFWIDGLKPIQLATFDLDEYREVPSPVDDRRMDRPADPQHRDGAVALQPHGSSCSSLSACCHCANTTTTSSNSVPGAPARATPTRNCRCT